MQARQVAKQLGLKTADTVQPPVPRPTPADDHAKVRERWAPDKKKAFDIWEPAALVVVATDGPVTLTLWERGGKNMREQLGHNRAVWPTKLVKTASWKDQVDKSFARTYAPPLSTKIRLWAATDIERDKVAVRTLGMMADMSERDGGLARLNYECLDMGPDLDLGKFEADIISIGGDLNVRLMADAGVSAFLDAAVAEGHALVAAKGGTFERRVEQAIMYALGRG